MGMELVKFGCGMGHFRTMGQKVGWVNLESGTGNSLLSTNTAYSYTGRDNPLHTRFKFNHLILLPAQVDSSGKVILWNQIQLIAYHHGSIVSPTIVYADKGDLCGIMV